MDIKDVTKLLWTKRHFYRMQYTYVRFIG